jgi:DNA-binding beta-propeller fold protein YncE
MRLNNLPRPLRYAALAAALLYAAGAHLYINGSASKSAPEDGRAGNTSLGRGLSPAPPVAPAAEATSVRQINLVTNDLIVDPKTQTLYVSVPSRAGGNGNSIVPIDPKTGALGTPVFVGSEPNRLAVSDDGRFIYVGLDGANSVRRFDLASQTPGLQFYVGLSYFSEPLRAAEIKVAPGHPETVAVRGGDDFSGSVFVYDNGVQRGAPLRLFGVRAIEFPNSASRLYAALAEFTPSLQRINLTPGGPVAESSINTPTLLAGMKFDGGLLYSVFGSIFAPEAGAQVGVFDANSNSSVAPDSSVGRVYFVTTCCGSFGSTLPPTLKVYDRATLQQVASFAVPNATGTPAGLVRWGTNGLAFRTETQVFIIQTTLVPSSDPVPPSPPTPTPTPTPSPAATPGPGEFRSVSLPANDLLVDPKTQTLYAAVPASAGAAGNSVTPINPFEGTTGTPVALGSEPTKLAVSDDGQYLYVAVDRGKTVRRIDLASQTAGPPFGMGSDPFFGALGVSDMKVMPGSPETLAVARKRIDNSPGVHSVALYDNGVQRTRTTLDPQHFGEYINQIEFSGSPSVLYGVDQETTGGEFSKMAAGPCGVSLLKSSRLFPAFGPGIKYENGLIYTESAAVIDPEAANYVGRFDLSGIYLMLPDARAGRAYFLTPSSTSSAAVALRVYDLNTFLPVGVLDPLPVSGSSSSRGFNSPLRWGTNGLAFRSGDGKVYLLQNDLIGGLSPRFTPAPPPPPPTIDLKGFVGNFGPSLPGVNINVTGAITATTVTDADGTFSLGTVDPCVGAFTVTPSKEGYIFEPPSLTITDPSSQSISFTPLARLIGLAKTAVSVPENANVVQVSVSRTGDLSQAATVDYETADGTASARTDYTAAFGTLRFGPNESTKTLNILLTDDGIVEGQEAFALRLKNPSGAGLAQQLDTETITILDNDTASGTTNPADDSQFYVRQHYHDFLNREPDAAGLQFWTGEIEQCGADAQCREVKRVNVSAAFFLSIEFQETGYLAYRTYKAAYGDATSPNVPGTVPVIRFREFLADAQRIGRDVQVNVGDWEQQLEANKNAYMLEFVSLPRFTDAFPQTMTAAQFVDKLDRNAGGVLSTAERQGLVANLEAAGGGTQARASALRQVAEDADLRNNERNRAFVLMEYFGYLRRNPDDAPEPGLNYGGWRFWLDKLEQFDGDYIRAEMVKAYISSDEYRKRFGR